MGATEEELKAVLDPESYGLFDEKEKVALQYAEELTAKPGEVGQEILKQVKRLFSPPEIVELTMAICVFNVFNRCNDGLGAEIDLPLAPGAFYQGMREKAK